MSDRLAGGFLKGFAWAILLIGLAVGAILIFIPVSNGLRTDADKLTAIIGAAVLLVGMFFWCALLGLGVLVDAVLDIRERL